MQNEIISLSSDFSCLLHHPVYFILFFFFFSQYPELMVASYNNNEDAPHEPDGVALVWNMKFKKTTPEYVFHCQVRQRKPLISWQTKQSLLHDASAWCLYEEVEVKNKHFWKKYKQQSNVLRRNPAFLNNTACQGLRVILGLFKTVPKRFSL